MKVIIESLGLAEILITIALVLMCVIAYYDCKNIDKKHDNDQERFDEKYPR